MEIESSTISLIIFSYWSVSCLYFSPCLHLVLCTKTTSIKKSGGLIQYKKHSANFQNHKCFTS